MLCNGLFHFLPIQGYGREIPWGCARNIFQGSQGLKLSFQGGQGKFSRGIIPVKTSLQVGPIVFLWGHFGITPWNSSPKVNSENCLPCMHKKWNSPIFKTFMLKVRQFCLKLRYEKGLKVNCNVLTS